MASHTTTEDLAYGDRWEGNRFIKERDRPWSRGPPRRSVSRPAPPAWERDYPPPPHRRERVYYDEEPRMRRVSPPVAELERRLVIDDRGDRFRSPSPVRRPGFLRRQSSLDTFDRRPRFREEYPPPVRRGDYRPDPYEPIPLPRSRALPPPRVYAERDLDEIKISDPDYYGNDEYYAYPERIREREVVRRPRRRDGSESRTSKGTRSHRSSHRSSSHTSTKRSASSSSDSSTSGGTTTTVKSEYPKKGKTRIPDRLVSKRALIDLSYPFTEEGSTIIVQKALGQQNIDDLLKLSEEYKKAEAEVAAARSSAGQYEEKHTEVFTIPPPPPPAPAAPPAPPTETAKSSRSTVRESSPARTAKTSRTARSHSTSTTSHAPVIVDAAPREISGEVPVGPLALIQDRRSERDINNEIARLQMERDLARRDHYDHHHHYHHSHHRSHSHGHHSHSPSGREMVKAERLPTGELVLYEQEIIREEEPRRGVRIEKDKKGPPPGIMKAMLATLT